MPVQLSKSIQTHERSFTGIINEISLAMTRIFNRRVKDVGLTRSQWQVLYLLYQHDGQTQTQLAETLTIAKPPLGKVVDRLEEDGWVERRDEPKDRRAKRVFLTEKVTPLIGPLEGIVDEIGDITTSGLSNSERKAFIKFLHIARQNLANEADANHD